MAKPRLIYFHDPICGWCYAIEPAVSYVFDNLKDVVDFELINIGLFMDGNMKPMDSTFQGHLHKGTKLVEEASGVKFSDNFFKNIVSNENYVYESATSGLALQAIKTLGRSSSADCLLFIRLLQKKFFIEGENISRLDLFVDLAKEMGISPIDFVRTFYDQKTRSLFEEERLKARGFPARAERTSVPLLILVKGDSFRIINHEANRGPAELLAHVMERLKQ